MKKTLRKLAVKVIIFIILIAGLWALYIKYGKDAEWILNDLPSLRTGLIQKITAKLCIPEFIAPSILGIVYGIIGRKTSLITYAIDIGSWALLNIVGGVGMSEFGSIFNDGFKIPTIMAENYEALSAFINNPSAINPTLYTLLPIATSAITKGVFLIKKFKK